MKVTVIQKNDYAVEALINATDEQAAARCNELRDAEVDRRRSEGTYAAMIYYHYREVEVHYPNVERIGMPITEEHHPCRLEADAEGEIRYRKVDAPGEKL